MTQHLSVKITDPTHTRGGYQLTARLASSLSSQAGSFTATDTNSTVVPNGSIQDMDATNYGTLTWNFDWTPPTTNAGNVNFYLIGLATGSPGSSTSGNGVYQSVATLTAAAAADFSLSASPSSLSIAQGSSGTSSITVAPLSGFTGSVSLSASGLPTGVTASFSTNPATATSVLTLTASSAAATGTATVTITGTSGSLSHTTTVALTVNAPANFGLSASPSSLSISQGSNGSSTIIVAPQNGFTGSVSLSASGLPTGVTASFNPNPATATSALTLTASSTAATGTATVTITGTSGGLSHTTTVSLTVSATVPPDFSLSASPSSLNIAQGSSGSSTITVAPQNGFTGGVNLSASGLPTGVTATFSQNPATATSALTLTISSTAASGTSTVTITGTSGSLSHTATVNLTVSATATPDFSLSMSPSSLSIAQGSTGTSTIAVAPQNGFTGSVNLSASGLPTGITATFSPNPATATSALTLTVSSTAATGTSTVTITGTSGSLSHTTTVALTVNAPPDFSLSLSSSSLSITQGSNGSSTIIVTPQNGFTGSVSLSASGLPSGVTASFGTNPATATSVLTLTASSTAATGMATVTITGTSGSLSHTTTIALTVNAGPDFGLSASPSSLSITQGSNGTSTIIVAPQNGFTGSVNLSAAGLPSGVTATFSPNPATATSALTLTVSSTATTGAATVTITGASGSLSHTTTLTLTVNSPDFSLSASPTSLSITQGTNGSTTINVAPQNGFTGSVNLSAAGLPSGVTASFGPNPATATSALTLTVSSTAATGTSTVTITGTSGSLSHTTTVALTVTLAPSTITATPTTLSFNYQIGLTTPVAQAISVTGSPTTLSFTASASGGTWLSVAPTSGSTPGTVNVTVNPGTLAPNIYTGTVTITSPGVSGTQTVYVTLAVTTGTPAKKINTTITSAFPNLVIDVKGNYNVAWTDSSAGVIFSRSTDLGANFSTAVTIPGSAGAEFQPQFVVDATGNNIDVVWAQSTSTAGSYNVLLSRSTDGGQTFATTPTTLTSAALPLADAPRIALESSGGVDVVWGRNETWAIHSPDGAAFATPAVKISTTAQDTGGPRIAVDSKGTIYVAWTDELNKLATGSYCLQTASSTTVFTNTVGGNFYFNITAGGSIFNPSNTRNLSSTDWAGVNTKWQLGFFGCSYNNLILLVDSQDNLHLVWSEDMPDQDVLVSAYPLIDSTGKARVSFPNSVASSVAASPHATVANNSSGIPVVHVVWSDGPSDLSTQATAGIFYTQSTDTSAPFGQSFAAPPTSVVNAESEFPQVAVDGGGNVSVAWQQRDPSVANAFDVFLAASFDGGKTFTTSMPVSPQSSNECVGTNTTDTTKIPPPPYNTCGDVQLKVDSTNASNLVWVDLNTTVSDILFARQTIASPSGGSGDFSVSLASSSGTSLQGQTANYTVNVGSSGAFNGSVSFTCTGLPTGATCASSPTSVTPPGSAATAVSVPATLAPGTYPFTIIGTAGGTTHSQPATLIVGTINATVAPGTSATIAVGKSANFTVSLTSTNGSAGPVSLGCGALASGLTCSFSPAQVNVPASGTVTTTMTITVTAKPASGSVYSPFNVWPNPSTWRIALSVLLLLAIVVLAVYQRNGGQPSVFVHRLAALALLVMAAAAMTSCTGLTKGVNGGTNSNPVTTQFALQGQSGTATINLSSISITVQ